MKILYGIVGEGMGHASRSKVVITHLLARGHQVLVATSGRAVTLLTDAGFNVIPVAGLTLSYADGAVDLAATLRTNLTNFANVMSTGFGAWSNFAEFAPDVVFSDFDSLASMYGRTHDIPVVSIDNMQIIDRCQHSPEITAGFESDFQLARVIVANRLPGCLAYVITTFFAPPVTKPNTYLVPPILRDAILNATISDAGHVLVYQTQSSDTRLLEMLAAFPEQEFVVYGTRSVDPPPGNVRIEHFSEQSFVDDLASSSAVIANGGFTLLGEALYLGKPVFSVPVRNHAEQELNARYLERLGFGMSSETFDANALAVFLDSLDGYRANIRAAGRQDGNRELYAAVDSILAG